jgi:phage baseplate assembly protein W
MQIDFPYHFDGRKRSAAIDESGHIRDLIEQILFTNPGERVNRPEFGAGVAQLVFGPASPEAAATAGFMIRGALQQYLGQRILVEDVEARAIDAGLSITIVYRRLRSDVTERAEFTLAGGGHDLSLL